MLKKLLTSYTALLLIIGITLGAVIGLFVGALSDATNTASANNVRVGDRCYSVEGTMPAGHTDIQDYIEAEPVKAKETLHFMDTRCGGPLNHEPGASYAR